MKIIEVCEVIKIYHVVAVEDAIDIEDVVSKANYNSYRCDTGCEAIQEQLDKLQNTYGFEYEIKEEFCGREIDSIYVMGEVD